MDGGLLQPCQEIPQSAYMAGSFGVGRIRAFPRDKSFPLLVVDGNLESCANLFPRGSGARIGNKQVLVQSGLLRAGVIEPARNCFYFCYFTDSAKADGGEVTVA